MDKIEKGKKIAQKMLEDKTKERQKKIEQGKDILKTYKKKKESGLVIAGALKKKLITPITEKINAAKTLQAAIKRKEPNQLLGKQMEVRLINKYEDIDDSIPTIQAAIRRKLVNKPKEFSTGKKNVYPQAPLYKIDKLKEAVRSVMESLPETKGEIKLNASKSDMIQFLDKYKYPLEEALSGFKPTEKRKPGRPKKQT